MATVSFHLRDASANTPQPVTLYVRHLKERLKYATGLKVHPKYWDAVRQRIKNTSNVPDRDSLNGILNDLEAEANRYQADAKLRRNFTLEGLRAHLENFQGKGASLHPAKKETLLGYCARFIEESADRTQPNGKRIAPATIQKYCSTLALLEAFEQEHSRRLDFGDVDLEFYKDFTAWLQKRPHRKSRTDAKGHPLGYSANAIGKHIQILKTFLNEANLQGVTEHRAHQSKYFKAIKEDSEGVYLSESELDALLSLPLGHQPRLERVRDVFIIGAWTGLRFSDFSKLDPARHIVQEEGGEFIQIETTKTGVKVFVPVFPAARAILDKYPEGLPAPISNQKFNDYLKEVCRLGGIRQPVERGITIGGKRVVESFEKWQLVGSHTARRSFATNMYRRKIPATTIRAITGHATERAFFKYIKLDAKEHAQLLKTTWVNAQAAEAARGKIVNL